MAKREAHAGTISKVKGRDLWQGKIQVGFKADGTPLRKTVYDKTQSGAGEKLRTIAYKFGVGDCYDPSTMVVREWLKYWLNDFKKSNIKPKTFEVYKQFIDCHIDRAIGHLLLKNLTTMHIQQLVNEKQREGLSSASIRKMHSIINSSLDQAFRNDMIPKNPAKFVQLPTLAQKNIRAFTDEEVKKFFIYAKNDPLYPLFVVALSTGLRLGELLALNWGDIDFRNELVSVSKTVVSVEDIDNISDKKNITLIQDSPKTRSSRRKVPLSQKCIELLKQHKQSKDSLLVFSTKTGNILSPRNVQRSFSRIVAGAKLEKCGFHTLRHTFATKLFEAQTSAKVISEYLGHSKVTHTLDIYVSSSPSAKKEVLKVIDSFGF